jgi:hypothetical protein
LVTRRSLITSVFRVRFAVDALANGTLLALMRAEKGEGAMSLMTRMKLLWMKLMLRNAGKRVAPAFDDLEGMGRRLARSPNKSGSWPRARPAVEPEGTPSAIEGTVMTIESLR